MSCNTPDLTKSQFVSALNTFAAAARSGDGNLVAFASNVMENMIDKLTFAPEEEEAKEVETQVVES